jgi:cytochrome b561
LHWLIAAFSIAPLALGPAMPPLNIRALLYAAIAWPHIPSIEELAAERKKTVEQLWKNVHAALGWARLALAALHIAAAPRPGSRVQGWCNVAYAAVFLESVTIPLHSFGSDDTVRRRRISGGGAGMGHR